MLAIPFPSVSHTYKKELVTSKTSAIVQQNMCDFMLHALPFK